MENIVASTAFLIGAAVGAAVTFGACALWVWRACSPINDINPDINQPQEDEHAENSV